MADDDSVSGRLKEARLQAGVRLRRQMSQERMAEMVSKEVGRTIHQNQWSRWEAGAEPPIDVIRVAAKLSGISEVYIAFGYTITDARGSTVSEGGVPAPLEDEKRKGA